MKGVKGNENAIFLKITGKHIDSLWEFEKFLLINFQRFLDKFKKNFQRKKFLNMDDVLYHLLKKMGHVVDEKNFSLLKTEKSKKKRRRNYSKNLPNTKFFTKFFF